MIELPGNNIEASFDFMVDTLEYPEELEPGKEYSGTIGGISGAQLFVSSYVGGKKPSLTYTVSKTSDKNLYIAITTENKVPTRKDCMWYDETTPVSDAKITIPSDTDEYKDGGPYFISVGPLEISDVDIPFKLTWECSDSGCSVYK